MKDYMTYVVMNTNDEKFMVVRREGGVEHLDAMMVYDTYEQAYKIAKIYNWGKEPLDETRHH